MRLNKVLGITGKIGSGKSTIAGLLSQFFDFTIINVDEVYHDMLKSDQELKERLVLAFGWQILKNEVVDRKSLRSIVLKSKENLEKLNNITHPLIFNKIKNLLKKIPDDKKIAIDAALLFQIGLNQLCSTVWFVECKEEILIERIRKRSGYCSEEIQEFLENQKDIDKYRDIANRIVFNNASIDELKIEIAKYLKEDELI